MKSISVRAKVVDGNQKLLGILNKRGIDDTRNAFKSWKSRSNKMTQAINFAEELQRKLSELSFSQEEQKIINDFIDLIKKSIHQTRGASSEQNPFAADIIKLNGIISKTSASCLKLSPEIVRYYNDLYKLAHTFLWDENDIVENLKSLKGSLVRLEKQLPLDELQIMHYYSNDANKENNSMIRQQNNRQPEYKSIMNRVSIYMQNLNRFFNQVLQNDTNVQHINESINIQLSLIYQPIKDIKDIYKVVNLHRERLRFQDVDELQQFADRCFKIFDYIWSGKCRNINITQEINLKVLEAQREAQQLKTLVYHVKNVKHYKNFEREREIYARDNNGPSDEQGTKYFNEKKLQLVYKQAIALNKEKCFDKKTIQLINDIISYCALGLKNGPLCRELKENNLDLLNRNISQWIVDQYNLIIRDKMPLLLIKVLDLILNYFDNISEFINAKHTHEALVMQLKTLVWLIKNKEEYNHAKTSHQEVEDCNQLDVVKLEGTDDNKGEKDNLLGKTLDFRGAHNLNYYPSIDYNDYDIRDYVNPISRAKSVNTVTKSVDSTNYDDILMVFGRDIKKPDWLSKIAFNKCKELVSKTVKANDTTAIHMQKIEFILIQDILEGQINHTKEAIEQAVQHLIANEMSSFTDQAKEMIEMIVENDILLGTIYNE